MLSKLQQQHLTKNINLKQIRIQLLILEQRFQLIRNRQIFFSCKQILIYFFNKNFTDWERQVFPLSTNAGTCAIGLIAL